MDNKMGIRAYARHRKVTPAAVRKALQSKRITIMDGKIDPEIADREWAANTDESKPRNSVSGNPGRGRTPEIPPTASSVARAPRQVATMSAVQTSAGGYAAARAVRESFDARIRELEFKRMSGAFVPVKDVERVAFETYRRVRDKLLAMPDRVGPVVAGMADIPLAIKTLHDEVLLVLEELAEGIFQR